MMTSKIIGVLLGGTLLFLFNMPQIGDIASAADQLKESPCEVPEGTNAMQAEQAASKGSHVVYGEVVRVDGENYVVKQKNGKEVSVKTDERTEKSPIEKGDHISANVDKSNHALWIRGNRGTDRRTEHVASDCTPKEN